MPDKSTYFPEKPPEVTCATCPYAYPVERGSETKYSCRAAMPTQECECGPLPADYWCAAHPWFWEQRAFLQGFARERGAELYRQTAWATMSKP
jgi:hypothetical protein